MERGEFLGMQGGGGRRISEAKKPCLSGWVPKVRRCVVIRWLSASKKRQD